MSFWKALWDKVSGNTETSRQPAKNGRTGAAEEAHPDGFTYEMIQFQMEYDGRPLCLSPFFDVNAPNDQRLTTYPEPLKPLETDTPKFLKLIAATQFHPINRAIAYQNWGADVQDASGQMSRPYKWFDRAAADQLSDALAGSMVRQLFLIFTMFEPGALLYFANKLRDKRNAARPTSGQGPKPKVGAPLLDMLGLWWAFSGDDMTDEASIPGEVAKAASILGLERLSLLTREFNGAIESALAEGFKSAPRLKTIRVFRRDDENSWPEISTRWSGR